MGPLEWHAERPAEPKENDAWWDQQRDLACFFRDGEDWIIHPMEERPPVLMGYTKLGDWDRRRGEAIKRKIEDEWSPPWPWRWFVVGVGCGMIGSGLLDLVFR